MADTEVTETSSSPNGSRPLPAFIALEGAPRFSANQLRVIKAATGLSLEQIMNDGAAVVQAVAYLELTRAGYAVTWEQAGDMPVELGGNAPDPTSLDNATASPHSADSGV